MCVALQNFTCVFMSGHLIFNNIAASFSSPIRLSSTAAGWVIEFEVTTIPAAFDIFASSNFFIGTASSKFTADGTLCDSVAELTTPPAATNIHRLTCTTREYYGTNRHILLFFVGQY